MNTLARRLKAPGLFIANLALALSAVVSTTVFAADNRPHQHGSGELNVVFDGHDVLLEVRLPAIDVVGFDHTPENAAHPPGSKTGAVESDDKHADFEGTAQFHCDCPDKLKAVSVLLFKSYPGVTSLRVQTITPGSQTSQELAPDDPILAVNP